MPVDAMFHMSGEIGIMETTDPAFYSWLVETRRLLAIWITARTCLTCNKAIISARKSTLSLLSSARGSVLCLDSFER